jgi:hypothetical protein
VRHLLLFLLWNNGGIGVHFLDCLQQHVRKVARPDDIYDCVQVRAPARHAPAPATARLPAA